MKRWMLLSGVAIPLALIVVGCKLTRAGYKEPMHRTISKEGSYEIREYPAFVVAETPMKDASGGDGSFGRLFRFIDGGNQSGKKISMTTPVLINPGTNSSMSFVMPEGKSLEGLPQPNDQNVILKKVEGGRFAVMRFSGSRTQESQSKAEQQLAGWIRAKGLTTYSAAIFAYYDPPWIPGPLRRNEVLIKVAD